MDFSGTDLVCSRFKSTSSHSRRENVGFCHEYYLLYYWQITVTSTYSGGKVVVLTHSCNKKTVYSYYLKTLETSNDDGVVPRDNTRVAWSIVQVFLWVIPWHIVLMDILSSAMFIYVCGSKLALCRHKLRETYRLLWQRWDNFWIGKEGGGLDNITNCKSWHCCHSTKIIIGEGLVKHRDDIPAMDS